ncbi:MAG: ribonuclease P protein component [Flavobacteriales bacterium]|nr:ribonuclease P protein component [Flavobacteriales bacterium]
MDSNSFGRDEKLKSRKQIERLFREGKSIRQYPVMLVWIESDRVESIPVQTGFVVSKRNFKRAVDRNKIKRQMREVFRTHKHGLYEAVGGKGMTIDLMWIYTGKDHPEFKELTDKISAVLERFANGIQSSQS